MNNKASCLLSGNITYQFTSYKNIIPSETVIKEKNIVDSIDVTQNKQGGANVIVKHNGDKLSFKNVYHKIVVEGSSINIASILTKLGCKTSVYAPIGNDPYGLMISSSLREAGINFHPIISKETAITASITENGKTTLFCVKPEYSFDVQSLTKKIISENPTYIIATSCRNQQDLALTREAFLRCPDAKHAFIPHKALLWDENKKPTATFQDTLDLTNILQVNLAEFYILTNKEKKETFEIKDMKRLTKRFNDHDPEAIIVTQGKDGSASVLFSNGKHEFSQHNACYIGNIIDTNGSGDSYLAAFIKASMLNFPHKNKINFAAWVAARNGLGLGGNFAQIEERDVLRFQ